MPRTKNPKTKVQQNTDESAGQFNAVHITQTENVLKYETINYVHNTKSLNPRNIQVKRLFEKLYKRLLRSEKNQDSFKLVRDGANNIYLIYMEMEKNSLVQKQELVLHEKNLLIGLAEDVCGLKKTQTNWSNLEYDLQNYTFICEDKTDGQLSDKIRHTIDRDWPQIFRDNVKYKKNKDRNMLQLYLVDTDELSEEEKNEKLLQYARQIVHVIKKGNDNFEEMQSTAQSPVATTTTTTTTTTSSSRIENNVDIATQNNNSLYQSKHWGEINAFVLNQLETEELVITDDKDKVKPKRKPEEKKSTLVNEHSFFGSKRQKTPDAPVALDDKYLLVKEKSPSVK